MPSVDLNVRLAYRYFVAVHASPLAHQIAAMLKKKLGPRLDHEREDVESLISSVLNHRDLAPILENFLAKATHNTYILDKVEQGVRMDYHKGVLSLNLSVLGEEFKFSDGTDALESLFDDKKADRALEKATGAKMTYVGKNTNYQRDPGSYEAYCKYVFRMDLPMPRELFFLDLTPVPVNKSQEILGCRLIYAVDQLEAQGYLHVALPQSIRPKSNG